ncbi:MAG TPA: TraB/GumN family protein [Polyangiaceae bacterium]|jgi:hypothetical protein
MNGFVRFVVFVVLLLGCGGSKGTEVETAHPATSVTVATTATPPAPSATASAQTQPTDTHPDAQVAAWHPLLYRVAGAKPSYLFGTIHVPDPRIETFPPDLDKAIDASDEIVNEMPLDSGTQLSMIGALQLPQGKSLTTELPAALYARLKDAFSQKGFAMALPRLDHFKVWAVAAQVALLDHLKDMAGGKPIDIHIHDKAKDAGKTTSGLETAAEQLAVFDGLTKDEQARMLEQTLDQRDKDLHDGKDPVASLMNLYIAGSETPLLDELNAGFDLTRPLDKKLLKRLITDRNKRMSDRIAALVKAHPTRAYFFAVGAAHLLGDDGVVAQLKKKGMTIERVTAP